jgi:CheY-like chemotaxis protein
VKKTILYVDDDADDREFLSDAIKDVNPQVEVVLAENGLKALDYLNTVKNEHLPCVIILDINMPYMDGRQTSSRIRSEPGLKDIPIIVFTSSANPNDKVLFNSLGIEFISKPNNISFMKSIATQMLVNCSGE